MDTALRIEILRRSGFATQTIAAILGVDPAEVHASALDPADVPDIGGGGGGGAAVLTSFVQHDAEEHVNSALDQWTPAPTPDIVSITLTEFKAVQVYARAQVKSPEGDWCQCALFVDDVKQGGAAGGSASQFQQLTAGRSATGVYGMESNGAASAANAPPLGGGVTFPLDVGEHIFELRYYGNSCHMQNRLLSVVAA